MDAGYETTHVVLPSDGGQSDGISVLIEDERERDGEVEHGETLGTELERQDLDGVRDDKGRVRNIVSTIVEEDECDDCVGGRVVSGDGVTGGGDGLATEEQEHADVGGEEESTTTGPVADETTDDGDDEVVDLEDTVDQVLGSGVGDADRVQDLGEVVGDETVAGPLRELRRISG